MNFNAGWSDPDTLYGNLASAYSYEKIRDYDAIGTGPAGYTNGLLSLFRNSEEMKTLAVRT